MVNIYDQIFEKDQRYDAPTDYKLDFVKDWVTKNNFHQVLDVGCGRGHYLKMLAQSGVLTTGLEPSRYIVSTLNGYDVICDNILGQAKKKRVWEALICMDVLEHIGPSEIEANVRALAALSENALIGIANHSDIWNGQELHLLQQKPPWWENILLRYYSDVSLLLHIKRYFIFEAKKAPF